MKFKLKDFRQLHRLYQSDMAELLQTNQSTISRMEMKDVANLSYPQIQSLYERFGHEDVDAFMVEDNISIIATNNHIEAAGTQNNGFFGADAAALAIIRQQSETLAELTRKQAELSEKLFALLEKLAEKI